MGQNTKAKNKTKRNKSWHSPEPETSLGKEVEVALPVYLLTSGKTPRQGAYCHLD